MRKLKSFLLFFVLFITVLFCFSPILNLHINSSNMFLLYFIDFLTICLLATIIYNKKFLNPYNFFIIVSVFTSLIYVVLYTPLSTPDANAHFSASYRFSSLVLNKEEGSDWIGRKEDSDFYGKIFERWKINRNPVSSDYGVLIEDASLFVDGNTMAEMPLKEERMKFYSVINYLPLSFGFILGRICHLGPLFLIYLSRLLLLFCYILTVAHAIKKTPVGKNIIAMTALLPMPLMMSSALSYDGMVILSSFAFISSVFCLKFDKTKCSLYESIFWAFIIGGIKGGGYILLIPLVFMLIDKEKRDNVKNILLICLSGLFSLILFDVILVYNQHLFQFGIANNGKMLASDAFYHPLMYLKMAYKSYCLYGVQFLEQIGGRYLAWLEETMPAFISWSCFSIMLVIGVFEQETKHIISKYDKIIMCFVIGLALFFIPVMLLSWTPVGFDYIAGIQGRYFLPVFPLILIIISYSLRNIVPDSIVFKYKDNVFQFCYMLFVLLSVIAIYYISNLYLTR